MLDKVLQDNGIDYRGRLAEADGPKILQLYCSSILRCIIDFFAIPLMLHDDDDDDV